LLEFIALNQRFGVRNDFFVFVLEMSVLLCHDIVFGLCDLKTYTNSKENGGQWEQKADHFPGVW